MKLITKLLWVMLALTWAAVGLMCWQLFRDCGVEPQVGERVPTVQEIQKMVGCEKIDGIIGKETLERWSEAIIKQEAAKHNYMYE